MRASSLTDAGDLLETFHHGLNDASSDEMTSTYGYDDIQALIEDSTTEGLRLEFKEKEDPSTPKLTRIDKRNIAQAVSSFATPTAAFLSMGCAPRDAIMQT